MGQAKRRGSYEDRVKQAKKMVADNPATTLNNQGPDMQAINADQGHMQIHSIIMEYLDDNPKRCYDLIGGSVIHLLDNIDYLHESADRNINTHVKKADARDPVTGKVAFEVGDHFVDVRGTTRSQTRHLFENYIKDWDDGKPVLKPGVSMDNINGKMQVDTVISYCCDWGAEALCMQIGLIKTPSGVVKTNIKTMVVPKAVWINWSQTSKDSAFTGAVSW